MTTDTGGPISGIHALVHQHEGERTAWRILAERELGHAQVSGNPYEAVGVPLFWSSSCLRAFVAKLLTFWRNRWQM